MRLSVRRSSFAILLLGIVSAHAADDQAICDEHSAFDDLHISACDRAIASNRFTGSALAQLYLSRAHRFEKNGDAEQAYLDYAELQRMGSKDTSILFSLFLASVKTGRIDQASQLADQISAVDRNNGLARLVEGVRSLKQQQYATAQQNFNRFVHSPITDLVAALLSGWATYGAGNLQAAVDNIDKLGGPDWYAPYKNFHTGMILELAGMQKAAGVRLERAYKLNDALRVTDEYARWLSRNKDASSAAAVYEAFDKKYARHLVLGLHEARADKKMPPLVDSAQQGAAEVLYGIGDLLTHQGGEELALIYLQLALYLNPDHSFALLALGDLYELIKKPQLAINVYQEFSPSSPLKRIAQIKLATDLDAVGRTDKGVEILRTMIAGDRNDLEAIIALGNIERAHSRFEDCSKTYTQGIEASADVVRPDWVLFYYRGICYERTQQWAKAEPDLQRALELNPNQPHVMNYLGYSWVDRGIHLDEGLNLIQRAVRLRPDDGYIVDSLGWAFYQSGRFEDALVRLKQAAVLQPDDPILADHLGDGLWRVGRREEAKVQWVRARALQPAPEDLKHIEQKLLSGLQDHAPAVVTTAAPAVKAGSGRDAPRRVALVIGDLAYQHVPELPNPKRDAAAIADVLRKIGFQEIVFQTDATRDGLLDTLRKFAARAERADWALVYFAGHGIEMGGINYVIPIDATLATDRDVELEAVALDRLITAADGAKQLRLVLLDACRDNPFISNMQASPAAAPISRVRQANASRSTRSTGQGLAELEPEAGTLVVFAAKHGQVALDGDGTNSPFASAIINRLPTPGLEVRRLFDFVRDDVMSITKRQQQPFSYGSLPGSVDFFFVPKQ